MLLLQSIKRFVIFPFVMALGFFMLGAGPVRAADGQGTVVFEGQFATAPLEIVTATGSHAFTVEVAGNDAQHMQGLMFRRVLAPDRGMLFIYPVPQVINMWMKNTLIPLDMLFLDARGKVFAIHERAVPGSLRTISSGGDASAVLEVPGGTVDRLGIGIGDRIVSPALNGN